MGNILYARGFEARHWIQKSTENASNCSLPDALASSKGLADVHSSLSFFVVSRPGRPRPTTTPIVPDPKLTPGDTFGVTPQDLCASGYAREVRDVPAKMKGEVYREYGITSHRPGDYEIDHLISLELGGSNSINNLWPESHRTSPIQQSRRAGGCMHELRLGGPGCL
jgi:hypothetical protein